MGPDEEAALVTAAPSEPVSRAWWDVSPTGADPDRPVPRRPNRDDLRYDRRVQMLAVGIVVVTVLVVVVGWSRRPTHVARVSLPATAGQATSPAQAGLGYLTAVSTADAAGVLAYLARAPQSTELVTDAVLAESARLGPISDIVVLASREQAGSGRGTVTVQYQLGQARVIDTYQVAKSADGFWRLARPGKGHTRSEEREYGGVGFVPVDLPQGAAQAGLTLNGVAVSGTVDLLPGTYQVGSTNPMLDSSQVLRLSGLSSDLLANEHALRWMQAESHDAPGSYQLAALPVELTASAQDAVAQAAATAAAQCLTEARLETSCSLQFDPFDYKYAGTPVESTVRWNVEAGSLDLAQTRPTTVRGGHGPCSDATGAWVLWKAGGDFRVDHRLLDVDNAEFVVPGLHAPAVMTAVPRTRLTDAGQQQVATAAARRLDSCLAATTLRTCGFGNSLDVRTAAGDFTLVENTATWSVGLGGTDLGRTAPQWQYCDTRESRSRLNRQGTATVCATDLFVTVRMSARTTRGTTEVLAQRLHGYRADISDPDHIRVDFR